MKGLGAWGGLCTNNNVLNMKTSVKQPPGPNMMLYMYETS